MMRLTSFAKIFAQVLLESITRLSSHMSQHHNPSQLICVDTSITASETEAPLLTAVGRVLADCVRRTGPGTCRHPVLQQPPPPPPPLLLSNLSSAHRSSSLSTVSTGFFASTPIHAPLLLFIKPTPLGSHSALCRRIQWALIYAHTHT